MQAAAFSKSIHVGRLTKAGDAFADKQERTDMTLAAVAQYVDRNFSGAMNATFPGIGLALEVRVRPLDPEGGPR